MLNTIFRDLFCDLSETEWTQRVGQLASAITCVDDLKGEVSDLAEALKRKKELVAEEEGHISRLARQVAEHREKRPVECRLVFHYPGNTVFLVRLDSDTAIEVRAIREDERQVDLQGKMFAEAEEGEAERYLSHLRAAPAEPAPVEEAPELEAPAGEAAASEPAPPSAVKKSKAKKGADSSNA